MTFGNVWDDNDSTKYYFIILFHYVIYNQRL